MSSMWGCTITDRYRIAFIIDKLKLYTHVEFHHTNITKPIIGNVHFIFRANMARNPEDVKKYFQCDEHSKWYSSMCKPGKRDWIVVRRDNGNYFAFPRTMTFSRYLTALKFTELELIEIRNLKMKWKEEDFARGQKSEINTNCRLGNSD